MEFALVTNRPTFINKDLEKATRALIACDLQVKQRQYDIAAILAEVEVKKLYADDGFSSCAEYAMNTFGIQKTTAYGLIKIGMEYVRPILNKSGKVIGHCSNLLPPADAEKQDAPLVDFTPRQLSTISPLKRDMIIDLVNRGEIKPTMTNKQLQEVVKLYTAKPVEDTEQEPEPTQEPEQEPTQEPDKRSLSEFTDEELIIELKSRGYIIEGGDNNV